MILCSYDIESTGLDKTKDRIIEVGLALYSTGQQKILESTGFLVKPSDDVVVSQEITDITGITQSAVDRFGYSLAGAFESILNFMNEAEAVIGHNVLRFDKPMTEAEAKRIGCTLPDKLWIDTMTDLPNTKGEQLITMCAKQGWVNPNQHSAEDDAKSVLKLIQAYDIDKIIERAKSPTILVRSHQDRNNNADAKKFHFRWSPNQKIWWKSVKEMDIDELAKQVPFSMSILGKEVTLEQLEN